MEHLEQPRFLISHGTPGAAPLSNLPWNTWSSPAFDPRRFRYAASCRMSSSRSMPAPGKERTGGCGLGSMWVQCTSVSWAGSQFRGRAQAEAQAARDLSVVAQTSHQPTTPYRHPHTPPNTPTFPLSPCRGSGPLKSRQPEHGKSLGRAGLRFRKRRLAARVGPSLTHSAHPRRRARWCRRSRLNGPGSRVPCRRGRSRLPTVGWWDTCAFGG